MDLNLINCIFEYYKLKFGLTEDEVLEYAVTVYSNSSAKEDGVGITNKEKPYSFKLVLLTANTIEIKEVSHISIPMWLERPNVSPEIMFEIICLVQSVSEASWYKVPSLERETLIIEKLENYNKTFFLVNPLKQYSLELNEIKNKSLTV